MRIRMSFSTLVERQRSARDERQVHVQLTKAGRDLRSRTRCLAELLPDRSGMAPGELVELDRQVQRLRNAMSGSAQQDWTRNPSWGDARRRAARAV